MRLFCSQAFEAELASPLVLQNKKKSATLRGLAKRGHELESKHFEQERSGKDLETVHLILSSILMSFNLF